MVIWLWLYSYKSISNLIYKALTYFWFVFQPGSFHEARSIDEDAITMGMVTLSGNEYTCDTTRLYIYKCRRNCPIGLQS